MNQQSNVLPLTEGNIKLVAQKMLEEKTLEETIVGVVKTDNPALVDAFHDWLVEKAYSHLVETGKLERVE